MTMTLHTSSNKL